MVFHIVSFLTLKEAARTSILSNRWKGLWKSAVTILDFEALTRLKQIHVVFAPMKERRRWPKEHRRWFIDWATRVVTQLQQHNNGAASKLSKFRVYFSLNKVCNAEGDIDGWLEFALSKGIEHLELSLDLSDKLGDLDFDYYPFSQGCFNHIKTLSGLTNIKSLRSLRLSYVDIKDEVLQHFISNCPLLEELVVDNSSLLKTLKVVGSSTSPLPLKHVEVEGCDLLRSIEIDHAPHLTYLRDQGTVAELCVNNCARLVDVAVEFNRRPHSIIRFLSSYAGQLESVALDMSQRNMKVVDMPELPHVKLLTLRSFARSKASILDMLPVINACPCLQKLTVKLLLFTCESSNSAECNQHVDKAYREGIKVVEVVGFSGYHVDCEFIDYVLEYFVGLERILIDRGLITPYRDGVKNDCSKKQAKKAKKLVLKFKSNAPPLLEFVVI